MSRHFTYLISFSLVKEFYERRGRGERIKGRRKGQEKREEELSKLERP